MRSFRMLGHAVMAALLAMAVADVGSALAEDTEVVLCEQLLKLCVTENGRVLPMGTEVLAFSENIKPVLLGALGEKCDESQINMKVTSTSGRGAPLLTEITSMTFSGNCTPCSTLTMTGLPYMVHLSVSKEDKYTLEMLKGLFSLSGCPLGVTCSFKAAALAVDVHDNGGEFALIETLQVPAEFDTGTGGKTICGETAKFDADYIVKCEEKQGAGEFPCWPSLELFL